MNSEYIALITILQLSKQLIWMVDCQINDSTDHYVKPTGATKDP